MRKTSIPKLLLIALLTAAMTGCGGGKQTSGKQTESVKKTEAADPDKPYAGTTLTYWVPLHANVAASVSNLGDTQWAKNVEKETGIHLKFIHPAQNQQDEAFSILVASGEYPDIIEYTWNKYTGGPSAAISDGVIKNLNKAMKSNAPNLKKIFDAHPDVAKMVKTQEGDYYCYPFLRGLKTPNETEFSSGFVIRKDVLDKLGLKVPETIDEWDTVLRAFKKNGFSVPFTTRKEWMKDVWSPGFDSWGADGGFYVEDGVVKCGLIEKNRKEFLQKMAQWYADGLIDRDYLVADKASCQTYFTTGKSAATYAPGGQGLGAYVQIMSQADPNITTKDIVSAVPVTSVKGKNAKFSKMNQIFDNSGSSAAISTQCKHTAAAQWLLDWMYSEKGELAMNFGVEGESYNMVDGQPVYTDTILKNPDGLTVDRALALYTRGSMSGPLVQDERWLKQYYSLDNQQEALKLWTHTDMGKYAYPPAIIANKDSEKFANIMSNVNTLSDEMEAKFIAGTASLNGWDDYVKQLKDFGIEDALKMKQKAYDQYMKN